MGPDDKLVYLWNHTSSIMARQADQVLMERMGIGLSQLRILKMLEHEPDVQQRQLADNLGQTEASVSRQIKLLQDRGMLTVRVNPKSKRERLALPTAKGFKMAEAASEVLAQHHRSMIALINPKQRDQLIDMLQKFHSFVCSRGKQFACDHPYESDSEDPRWNWGEIAANIKKKAEGDLGEQRDQKSL